MVADHLSLPSISLQPSPPLTSRTMTRFTMTLLSAPSRCLVARRSIATSLPRRIDTDTLGTSPSSLISYLLHHSRAEADTFNLGDAVADAKKKAGELKDKAAAAASSLPETGFGKKIDGQSDRNCKVATRLKLTLALLSIPCPISPSHFIAHLFRFASRHVPLLSIYPQLLPRLSLLGHRSVPPSPAVFHLLLSTAPPPLLKRWSPPSPRPPACLLSTRTPTQAPRSTTRSPRARTRGRTTWVGGPACSTEGLLEGSNCIRS